MQGLIRWTRWSVPTSTTPPAVYHIHGSAAGAFPGVAISAADEKLKVKGLLEAEVTTTDEILDAFDGKPAVPSACACRVLTFVWSCCSPCLMQSCISPLLKLHLIICMSGAPLSPCCLLFCVNHCLGVRISEQQHLLLGHGMRRQLYIARAAQSYNRAVWKRVSTPAYGSFRACCSVQV